MKTGEDRDELKNISVDNELQEDSDLTSEEKIDDWHIDKYSDNIDLICTDCYNEGESEVIDENSVAL